MAVPLEPLLIWVVVVAVLMPVPLGFIMRYRLRKPFGTVQEVLPLEVGSLDSGPAAFLTLHEAEFLRLGFTEATHFRLAGQAQGAWSCGLAVVNRATGDRAFATLLSVSLPKARECRTAEFVTRYASGTVYATDNTPWLRVTGAAAGCVHTQLPSVQDAGELYRLHRCLVDKGGTPGRPELDPPERALDSLRSTLAQAFETMTRRGLIAYDERDGLHYYTLKGAITLAFTTWPTYAYLWHTLRNWRARRVLREFARAEH